MITDQLSDSISLLTSVVEHTNTINKRLTIVIVCVSLIWGILFGTVAGFYFLGQGYADTSQTIEDTNGTKIQQQTKGSE